MILRSEGGRFDLKPLVDSDPVLGLGEAGGEGNGPMGFDFGLPRFIVKCELVGERDGE